MSFSKFVKDDTSFSISDASLEIFCALLGSSQKFFSEIKSFRLVNCFVFFDMSKILLCRS